MAKAENNMLACCTSNNKMEIQPTDDTLILQDLHS